MGLDAENFTDKTSSYLNEAVKLAKEYNHIELRPAHLAVALFEDSDGLAAQGTAHQYECGDSPASAVLSSWETCIRDIIFYESVRWLCKRMCLYVCAVGI